jgi:hypothetical protein
VNNPQLRATLILMCFTVNPASGRNWTNYYSPGNIDVLGWDCYNHGEARGVYGDPATLYSRAIQVSRGAGLPWGMAEIGSTLARGDTTGTRRAAWLIDVARYLGGQGRCSSATSTPTGQALTTGCSTNPRGRRGSTWSPTRHPRTRSAATSPLRRPTRRAAQR